MITHFRDFDGDNETPLCGERSGAASIEPDAVTCPQCRILMNEMTRAVHEVVDSGLDAKLRETLRRMGVSP